MVADMWVHICRHVSKSFSSVVLRGEPCGHGVVGCVGIRKWWLPAAPGTVRSFYLLRTKLYSTILQLITPYFCPLTIFVQTLIFLLSSILITTVKHQGCFHSHFQTILGCFSFQFFKKLLFIFKKSKRKNIDTKFMSYPM